MNLAFATQQIRRLCENEAHADRVIGLKAARALRRRLADLIAAECVSEMVAGQPGEISGTNQMRIDLGSGVFLVFCANHNEVPLSKTGSVAWTKVSRIKILSIEVSNE